MPPLTAAERQVIMGEVILQIQSAGYIYDLGQGASNWAQTPPPRGTRLNCQAVARLAKELAEQRGINGLTIVATKIEGGFFVPSATGVKALGGNEPPVQTTHVRGWKFDNHYRVKDAMANKVYDPTFGTSGDFNPVGIKCTSTKVDFPKMVSVYGEKYEITRTHTFDARLLSQGQTDRRYLVDNSDYR